mmetsp:Transcript_2151/g.4934  ORF Transcript_2151/g.4934 Transcript_2151/m.4934 type:complete len:220 (+) Transcript_2151:558-1217(+)
MQGDCVHYFFTLLKFALRALYKLGRGSHCVIISCTSKGATKLADLTAGLVDSNNVSCLHFFLDEALDHFGTQVINRFHFSRLQRQLASFFTVAACRLVDLNLHNFTLNNFCFLLYPHTDRTAEALGQCFRTRHFQRIDLRTRQHGEWSIIAQRLCHTHGYGSFTRSRLAGNEKGTTRNFSFLDHLQDHTCCSSCLELTDHTLRNYAGLQRIVQTKPSDM